MLKRANDFKDGLWEGVIREAVNSLAQGGTAIIAKRAMISVREKLRDLAVKDPRYSKVLLLNQVHDELIYESPEAIAKDVLKLVSNELENAVQLEVPIIAEGKVGTSWGLIH
jgi:DNA polymerase-1